MKQRLEEWLEGCDWDFHEKQFLTPYRITVHFCDWLEKRLSLEREAWRIRLLDAGAGMGANIYYMTQRFPTMELTGLEINPDCVVRGNNKFRQLNADRCSLECGDLLSPPRNG